MSRLERVIVAALALALSASASSQSMAELWKRLYAQAERVEDRLATMEGLAREADPSAAQVAASALKRLLIEQGDLKTSTERAAHAALVKLCLKMVGDAAYEAASREAFAIAEGYPDTLVRAEAFMALGKMRASEYLPQLIVMLKNLNLSPTADLDTGEKLAFGLIVAMDKYRAADAWEEVFYAANGWYSGRIKSLASRVLSTLTSDPTEAVIRIVGSAPVALKRAALGLGLSSSARAEDKVRMAFAALAIAHDEPAKDRPDAVARAELRKQAIAGLRANGWKGDAGVGYLDRSFAIGAEDEKLDALGALGANGGDAAASQLAAYVLKYHERRLAGIISTDEDRLIRAAITALGETRNPLGRPALLAIANSSAWTSGFVTLAREALKKSE